MLAVVVEEHVPVRFEISGSSGRRVEPYLVTHIVISSAKKVGIECCKCIIKFRFARTPTPFVDWCYGFAIPEMEMVRTNTYYRAVNLM